MQDNTKAKPNLRAPRQKGFTWRGFRLRLSQQAILLVILPLLLELFFFAFLNNALRQAEEEANRAEYARDVANQLTGISESATRAGTIAYFYSKGGSPSLKNKFQSAVDDITENFHHLEQQVSDDPHALAVARRLEVEAKSAFSLVEKGAQANREGDVATAVTTANTLTTVARQLEQHLDQYAEDYRKVGQAGPAVQRADQQKIKRLVVIGVWCNIMLAVFLVALFILTTGRRLGVIMDNVRRLAQHKQLHDQLGGDDELAHLDKTFHETEQLLSNTNRLREQLIGIASHELRTPLTSIDACLKLMLDGVYGELPEVARERAQGAEKSLVRLIELINDLLDAEKLNLEQ